jgi:NTP pyrophosphatase (non-canonical NTP hydrolase)
MYQLNEYQSKCFETRLDTSTTEYFLINLAGEVGELSSLFAKGIRDGRKFDFDLNVKKELGDILYHVAMLAADHGYTLEEIARGNVEKLSARKANNTLRGSGDDR